MGNQLTRKQIKRQDEVDNEIFSLLQRLAGINFVISHDIASIAFIREAVQEIICKEYGLMSDMEFYPYLEEEDE